jgi:hypothetical protein
MDGYSKQRAMIKGLIAIWVVEVSTRCNGLRNNLMYLVESDRFVS